MSSDAISFGKVVEEIGYRGGVVASRKRRTEESIPVASRQELFDVILKQLAQLQSCSKVEFTVCAHADTHEPNRIIVVSELDG